tara:strand:+ start:4671 stop:4886 length:216 start_codon:yes stop_codon:yes gene_type:complete
MNKPKVLHSRTSTEYAGSTKQFTVKRIHMNPETYEPVVVVEISTLRQPATYITLSECDLSELNKILAEQGI